MQRRWYGPVKDRPPRDIEQRVTRAGGSQQRERGGDRRPGAEHDESHAPGGAGQQQRLGQPPASHQAQRPDRAEDGARAECRSEITGSGRSQPHHPDRQHDLEHVEGAHRHELRREHCKQRGQLRARAQQPQDPVLLVGLLDPVIGSVDGRSRQR